MNGTKIEKSVHRVHKVFIKRRQVGGNKCWVSTACFASCVRGHRVRQVVVWGLVRQVADRWFVAWSDRWLASRTDRWLVGGWSDRWLVAWSLTAIVREVSDRVYGLKDRQVFALYDWWLVAWSEICHERKFLFLTTPGNSQIASVRFPFPKDRKNFVIAFPILNFGRNKGSSKSSGFNIL